MELENTYFYWVMSRGQIRTCIYGMDRRDY